MAITLLLFTARISTIMLDNSSCDLQLQVILRNEWQVTQHNQENTQMLTMIFSSRNQ